MQTDDFANPGMLWVDRGRALYNRAPDAGKSCSDCHGDAEGSMRAVATRYPQVRSGRLVNLTQQIAHCSAARQQHELPYESDALLSLTAYVAYHSRGMPFEVSVNGAARSHFEAGRSYYYTRRGQMNLACHHCHERSVGRMLRGDLLSEGHGNGYPAYRLDWQGIGSLHRRLRFCNQGIRAEPFEYGAPEYVALELFLAWRADELPLETPAVRR